MQINLFKAPLAESRRSWLWALEKTKHKETKGDEARGDIKEREKQTIIKPKYIFLTTLSTETGKGSF